MSAPADRPPAPDLRTMMRDAHALSDGDLQALLATAIRAYADRAEAQDKPFAAFGPDAGVTATQAVMTISAILKAVNIQLFELGMWQAWSGR